VGAAERLNVESVAALAREAGFDLCGFARAEPIPSEALSRWLEAGFDADMDWMGRRAAERLDPARLLPGARTVVALACNYFRPEGRGPIALYARGRDYHATLRDRVRALRRLLGQKHPSVETYACVDTGPMMEKIWAARAGVGYVGRNGCLITERFGSYVVLATIILDTEVDAYTGGPAEDRCGSCNLCVVSCPTGAIVEDRVVDARACLSYQTIENEGPAPEALRAAYDSVFGCDVCQTVCPLNESPLPAGDRFAPRAVASLSALQIAAMSKDDYERLVPGTALARARYDGLRRNAVYALGAARDGAARELLERLVTDGSELVREAAQWAIARIR
jgi:epoxyqueuosine reductase